MNARKILIVVLLIGLISGGYVYFFVWNKAHPDYAELQADFSMPASELYAAFTSNTEESSSKYNGKMIELSGEINGLEIQDSLVIAVYVFNEGMFGNEGVRCTFLNNNIKSIDEIKGKKIKGYCAGYNDVDVILEQCTLTNE